MVINEILSVQEEKSFSFEEFDAIFLNIDFISEEDIKLALQHISPFYSNACWIKPRFIRPIEKFHMTGMEYLVDGIALSPMEENVTNRTEEICERIQTLKIPRYAAELQSHIVLCLRLCNYCIVRGFMEFSTTTAPGLMQGFTTLFNTLFVNPEMNRRNAMFEFIQKLIDRKCVEHVRHLDRIHLCPDCHSPRLFIMECCPKCKSSNVRQESVIHHFRCANVSPESTYEYDGQLRCPKCRQFVRHIGVDYDRPADIYTCNNCDHTFLHADMKVYCTDCGKTCKTADLNPHDINIYRFTDEGIRRILNEEIVFAFSKEIWNGYAPFDMYQREIRWFSQSSTPNNAIVVLRFRLKEPGLGGENLVAFTDDIHVKFYHYNFTTHGKYFYLSHRCRTEDVEQGKTQLKEDLTVTIADLLSKYSKDVTYEKEHILEFHKGDNAEEFIRELTSKS